MRSPRSFQECICNLILLLLTSIFPFLISTKNSLRSDSYWQQVRRQSSGFPYDLQPESIKIHYKISMLKSLLTATILFSSISAVYLHTHLIKILLAQIEGLIAMTYKTLQVDTEFSFICSKYIWVHAMSDMIDSEHWKYSNMSIKNLLKNLFTL